jgi:hypothetical protein
MENKLEKGGVKSLLFIHLVHHIVNSMNYKTKFIMKNAQSFM